MLLILPNLREVQLLMQKVSPDSLFGFFLGSTLAGAGVYYYVVREYKASNELLTGDIYVRLCI